MCSVPVYQSRLRPRHLSAFYEEVCLAPGRLRPPGTLLNRSLFNFPGCFPRARARHLRLFREIVSSGGCSFCSVSGLPVVKYFCSGRQVLPAGGGVMAPSRKSQVECSNSLCLFAFFLVFILVALRKMWLAPVPFWGTPSLPIPTRNASFLLLSSLRTKTRNMIRPESF
jgi:hypothetical protein